MGLTAPSYGIHGTNNPASIGTAASNGCVRMFNKDVEDLFNNVGVGTVVRIF
ncbi:MAG TPA: L,D-transpeptidase [Clostridia bacterium]|nr:L,D-transpeptidase [Clostridia bacterium]